MVTSAGDMPGSSGQTSSGPPARGLVIVSAVFLSIFLAAFLLVMSFAFCCCRRWRERDAVTDYSGGALSSADRGEARAFPAEALPAAFAYVAGLSDDGLHGDATAATAAAAAGRGGECAVCLCAVRDGEMVRRLPACRHVYHAECIDRWLAAHWTCPLCRSELDPCKMAAGPPAAPPVEEVPADRLPV